MNRNLGFRRGFEKVEWKSTTNGRFLYAAQTHLSQDTEIRTALRASVLAHYVLSLARASDNSCELFELENALNPGSASGCTKPAGRPARPAHTCLDLHPGSPDCTISPIENVNLTPTSLTFRSKIGYTCGREKERNTPTRWRARNRFCRSRS